MESVPERVPVVVLGAGPAAFTLALALAEHGVRSMLLAGRDLGDGADATARVSAGALSALSRLGVDVAALGSSPPSAFRTFLGTRQLDSRPPDEPPSYANIRLGRLAAGLRAAVASSPHSVVREATAAGVEEDSDGVTVTVETPAGTTESCRADFVVRATPLSPGAAPFSPGAAPLSPGAAPLSPGAAPLSPGADPLLPGAVGASPTALQATPPGPLVERVDAYGHDVLVVVDVEASPPFPSERRLHLDPPWAGGFAVLEPTGEGRWRVEYPVPADALAAGSTADAIDAQVTAILGSDVPHTVLAVRRCPAGWAVPQTYRSGRTFFIGDATPTLASGVLGGVREPALDPSVLGAADVSRGIDDADNLAWKLAYALRAAAGDGLLESYEVERRAAVEAQVTDLAAALRSLVPTTRSARWRRHAPLHGGRRSARLRRIEDAWVADGPTYSSTVLQPGAGAVAPELPVRATDGWRGPLASLRGGPLTVVAIGPTETDAVALAAAVEAASTARAATTVGPPLPPHRFAGGAAANATAGLDAAGTALGNLLVVRPDGRVSWKVNGEDAPDEVAAALATALSRTVGR